MRFMVLLKANSETEAGFMPSEEILAAMADYNEQLARAGVMLAGEGLHPSSRGAKVIFGAQGTRVVDGPFTEAKELIAGFWMLETKSLDECIEWVKRAPMTPGSVENSPYPGDVEIEIRQIFEADDFGAELTPELREREAKLAESIAKKKAPSEA